MIEEAVYGLFQVPMQTFKYGYKTLMAHVVILLLSSFLLANTPVTQYLNEDPASSAEWRTNYDWEHTLVKPCFFFQEKL